MHLKLLFIISITLFFFSTSSVLARLALLENSIDPYSFTFFRLFFGTITLLSILLYKEKKINLSYKSNWISSFLLFSYAIFFSYSYVNLNAGIGTLIFYAMIQLLVLFFALKIKEKLTLFKVGGISLTFAGLVYLLYPSSDFELSFYHVCFMIISGTSWAFYTNLGKNTKQPLLNTADNFLKTLLYLGVLFLFIDDFTLSSYGIFLAFISGGITSALAYVLWYFLLPKLETTTTGTLQLLVPVITIFLSIIILDEELSFKLILATILILLGISLSMKKSKI